MLLKITEREREPAFKQGRVAFKYYASLNNSVIIHEVTVMDGIKNVQLTNT